MSNEKEFDCQKEIQKLKEEIRRLKVLEEKMASLDELINGLNVFMPTVIEATKKTEEKMKELENVLKTMAKLSPKNTKNFS